MKKKQAPDLSTPEGWAAGLDAALTKKLGGGIEFVTIVRPELPARERYDTRWKMPKGSTADDARLLTDRARVVIADFYQAHPSP